MKTASLDKLREERKAWLGRLIGEPPENVILGDTTEPVEPDPVRCGMGQGEKCCVFLTVGPDGFECARGGPLDMTIRNRVDKMTSKRVPESPWPQCMSVDPPE